MKRFGFLVAVCAAILLPQQGSAQCLQNGVPCGQVPATSGGPAPTTGTLILGTDGTNSYPILTDSAGRGISTIYSLPSIPAGTNTIGSIANTAFGISGTLPGFTSTPTFNLGTLNGAATDTAVNAVKTTLGSPFQAGGNIGNTAFGATQSGTWTVGLSGTLPAFAATPTFNLGTAPTLNTTIQGSVALGSSTSIIGNTIKAQVFPESTAVLAASGTFTASSHDSGVVTNGTPYASFTCFVNTDKAGTMVLSGSNDNSTFYTIVNQTFSASVPTTTTTRVLFRYNRCAVTNTATSAQGTFVLNSQFGQ